MKLPLLILACSLSFRVFAQDTTWSKTDAKMYGTRLEKKEQDALWNQNGYELYRLIGFKEYYINGLSTWLQSNGYTLLSTQERKGTSVFVFVPKISAGVEPKVYLIYRTNTAGRVTMVRLSGYPYALASIFVQYWPTDPQWSTISQIKRGVVATKHLIDERITFNFKGAPFIEITK